MSLDRLGDVDFALVGQRFIREELSESLNANVAPTIVLQGAMTHDADEQTRRASGVNLYAGDHRLFGLLTKDAPVPVGDEVQLNRAVG